MYTNVIHLKVTLNEEKKKMSLFLIFSVLNLTINQISVKHV